MTLYITYGSYASIYIETNFRFGARPLLKIDTFKKEKIVHVPFMQIIYTPKVKLENERRD